MTITFLCQSCPSEFTVDDKLAGRSGKCKRCGAKFVVPKSSDRSRGAPPQAAVATKAAAISRSGDAPGQPDKILDRLANSLALKPVTEEYLRLAQPRSSSTRPRPAIASPSMGWLNAVNSQIALKPVTMENLRSFKAAGDLEPDSIAYQPADSGVGRSRKRFKSNLPGGIKFNYDQTFRKTAKLFRWINETSYGISILFMLLAIVGYVIQLSSPLPVATSPAGAMTHGNHPFDSAPSATQGIKLPPQPHHRLITIGLSGIVALNVVRLVAGLANLIAIPFRKSPLQGVLFLIPPITFIYIWQHWKKVHKAVQRIIGPIFALMLVTAIYMLIPSLHRYRHARGNLRDQVQDAVKSIQGDVKGSVKDVNTEVNRLKRELPDQIDKARKSVGGLPGQAQEFLQKNLPDQIENAQKAVESVKDQVRQSLGNQPEPTDKESTKP